MKLSFQLTDPGDVDFEVRDLVIAGWTGRDKRAVEHHIDELKALGVAPPSRTPLFYRVGADRLTQKDRIQVVGDDTSGEAEVVMLARQEGYCITLGSDHTDRKAEAISVALSKQLCPKPVAASLWSFDSVLPHWDDLILRSWAWIGGERQLYQEGTLAEMLPVADLTAAHGDFAPGQAMFCGTLPALGGVRSASRFEMELEDPVRGRTIAHAYDIEPLPVVDWPRVSYRWGNRAFTVEFAPYIGAKARGAMTVLDCATRNPAGRAAAADHLSAIYPSAIYPSASPAG